MATIHGKSGSTQYLLKGTKPINGKYFSTLAEMQHFYTHYEEILTETETTADRKQDEKILVLSQEATKLDKDLREGLARQTVDVDKNIDELNRKITDATGFFSRTGCRVQHWFAVALRDTISYHPLVDDGERFLRHFLYGERRAFYVHPRHRKKPVAIIHLSVSTLVTVSRNRSFPDYMHTGA